VPLPQLVPHVPQLLLSVCVFAHAPLQIICPAPLHVSASGGASIAASLPEPPVSLPASWRIG
jgi:hypothetical protein